MWRRLVLTYEACNTRERPSISAEHVRLTEDGRGRARADCPLVNRLWMALISQMYKRKKDRSPNILRWNAQVKHMCGKHW